MFFQNYYTTIIYAISLTTVMMGFQSNYREGKKSKFFFFRCLCSLVSIFLLERISVPFESYTMLLFVPALFICFYQKGKKLQLLQDALNAVLFLFIIIVLFGSPVLFFQLERKESTTFQILMGVVVLISSCIYAFYLYTHSDHRIKSRRAALCIMFLKSLILFFFSVVLPQFHVENLRLFYLSQWCFAMVLLFAVFLLRLYSRLEQSYIQLQKDRKEQREIEKEYKNMIQLKHYMIHLVEGFIPYFRRSDMLGAITYFERYIVPIRKEYLNRNDIKNIKNVLLSSVIENAINHSIHNDIQFDYHIFGTIEVEKSMEMDVFRILSEWVSNALEALQTQENGRLSIEMRNKEKSISFRVSNTVYPVLLDKKQHTRQGRGYGLAINEDIILKNRNLTATHEVRSGYYHHCLVVYPKQ